MQIEVQEIGNGKRTWERGYNAEMRVYVHTAGETILENLQNRRDHPHTFYRKEILPQVLAQQGINPERIQWSQKAGCTCPCSPGFILKGVRRQGDLHITIRAEAVE